MSAAKGDLKWDLVAQGIVEYAGLSESDKVVVREDTVNHFCRGSTPADERQLVEALAASQSVDEEMAREFVKGNHDSIYLEKKFFPGQLNAVLLSKKEYEQIFDDPEKPLEEKWNEFWKRFEGTVGMVSISNLIILKGGDRALMSIWYKVGPNVGYGAHLLFRRIGTVWACQELKDAPSGLL